MPNVVKRCQSIPAVQIFLPQFGIGQPPSLAEWGRGGLTPGVSSKKDQMLSHEIVSSRKDGDGDGVFGSNVLT